MKNLVLFSIILFCFFSCQKRDDTAMLIILKSNCGELIHKLDAAAATLQDAVVRSGNRKPDLKVLEQSQYVRNWKKAYLKNRNDKTLISYTDSVISNYRKRGTEDLIFKELIKNKNTFTKLPDSLTHYQTLYWALQCETILQNELAGKVGYDIIRCYFGGGVPIEVNTNPVKLGEPVYITFKIDNFRYDSRFATVNYNFENIYMENQVSKIRTKLKPFKVGERYILHAIPKEKGEHLIKGNIPTNLPKDYYQFLTIANGFKVI